MTPERIAELKKQAQMDGIMRQQSSISPGVLRVLVDTYEAYQAAARERDELATRLDSTERETTADHTMLMMMHRRFCAALGLDEAVRVDEMVEVVKAVMRERDTFREALEWYAIPDVFLIQDDGERARDALAYQGGSGEER